MFKLKNIDKDIVKRLVRSADSVRESNRAHALNMRDKGYTSMEVGDLLEMTPRTIINICNNYSDGGLDRAIKDDPRTGRPKELDDRFKAQIVAIVCSNPPEGFDRWTLVLLQERAKKDGHIQSVSKEAIRLVLKEHDLKPWQQKMWCVPSLNEKYIENMEDVLDVYEKTYDLKKPVICLDEKSVVLHEDKCESISMTCGKIKRIDSEYIRKGTANTFMAIEPKTGTYICKTTDRRTSKDFAKFLHSIERKYHQAKKIVLVMDNLNTHKVKSLIDFYGKEKGNEIWSRFEIHYTPIHGSWLNQAEIAIGMYTRQCLGKTRMGDVDRLRKKTNAWTKIANRKKITINWKFTKKDAQQKFHYE